MKKTGYIIFTLVCIVGVFLTCCKQTTRKGFTNEITSNINYEVIRDSVTGLYGFHSADGMYRIECLYDSVTPFHECTAAVCKNGLWGCIDAKGVLKVPCRYEKLRMLGNGVARIGDNGLYGLVTLNNGDTLLPPCCTAITVFNDEFLLLAKGNRYGLMNERLDIVTEEFYDSICSVHDGLIQVAMDGRYGLLDATGREVLNCMFDRIEPFVEDRARVKAGTMYGLIDRAGRLVLPCIYTQIRECHGSNTYIVTKLGRVGVVDKDGKRLIRTEHDEIVSMDGRILQVSRDNKTGFYDAAGNPTTELKYGLIRKLSPLLACVEENGRYGLVSLRTGQEICPCRFDRVESFADDYALVRDGKWGYIDTEGNIAIPCRYDEAKPFADGKALVAVAGRWMKIDKNGMEVSNDNKESL